MKSWKRRLCIWLLAALLPVQGIAAMVGHCGGLGLQHGLAASPQVQMPCAQHAQHHAGAPVRKQDGQAAQDAPCSACCAVPTARFGLDVSALSAAAAFAPVIDQFAQFVPPGLKRPPSSL